MFKRLLCVALLFGIMSLSAEDDPAKLFVANKCVKCHEISSLGIVSVSDKDPSEIKDLSQAGMDFNSIDAVKAYLLREVEKDGKKHKTKFKGEERELQLLATWILTLK